MNRNLRIAVVIGLVLGLASSGICAVSASLFHEAECEAGILRADAIRVPQAGVFEARPCKKGASTIFLLPCSGARAVELTQRIIAQSACCIQPPTVLTSPGNGGALGTPGAWLCWNAVPLYRLHCTLIC